jgi:hypothetical protein
MPNQPTRIAIGRPMAKVPGVIDPVASHTRSAYPTSPAAGSAVERMLRSASGRRRRMWVRARGGSPP